MNKALPEGVDGLIERLHSEAKFFRDNRPVAETTSSTERLCDEAADTIQALQARVDALEGVLRFYAEAWQQDVDAERTPFGWVGSIGPVEPSEDLLNDAGCRARSLLTPVEASGEGGS